MARLIAAMWLVWCAGIVGRADSGLAQPHELNQSGPPTLPVGEGRDLVMRLCADCHGLEAAVGQRRALTDWEETIVRMLDRGVGGTDDELKSVVSYLSRAFGKVNVNAADSRNLQSVLELSSPVADALIKGRPYATVADLAKIPGIDAKAIETMKDRIVF